jgi:hypothetical protein
VLKILKPNSQRLFISMQKRKGKQLRKKEAVPVPFKVIFK